MAPLATLSIFVSAFLLFLLEPMVAKMGLPWFGGSPAVWTTCLVFFQLLLLAGYAYAHVSLRLLGPRKQLFVHAALLALPLLALPPVVGAGSAPTPGAWPVPALVRALSLAVGLPFLVLATNGTLVQRWFAFGSRREPYFLYAASNAGSLLALVAYPFVLEPRLGLATQARLFSWAYAGWAVLSLGLIALTLKHAPAREEPPPPATTEGPSAGPLGWTLRAMVPSILLVAVSLRISTDVGAVPLLWVVPLALYLASFILAFSLRTSATRRTVLAVITALLVAVLLGYPNLFQKLWYMALPLGALFFGAWLCHADLARDRPPPARLTAYYLWISVGGAIGSLATNLIAPLLFRSVAEFPLSLALLALAIAIPRHVDWAAVKKAAGGARTLVSVAVPVVLLVVWAVVGEFGLGTVGATKALVQSPLYQHVPFAILAGTLLVAWRTRRAAQFCAAALVIAALTTGGARRPGQSLLYAQRSFFGTLRVVQIGQWRSLIHGTTNHGMERMQPAGSPPTMYYHPTTPMGWSVEHAPPTGHVGVVGLGTGSLARLVQPGQTLTYYEIDSMVEPIARTWFTYLGGAKAPVNVVLGDARLSLERATDRYDLLIVDAFSSDAIPVHLLTREAVRIYLDRLTPDGVVLFHISNRYLDLLPVLRGHAAALGAQGAINSYDPDEKADAEGASSSDVVALSRSAAAIKRLGENDWDLLDVNKRRVDWTDDQSSLLGLFKLHRRE